MPPEPRYLKRPRKNKKKPAAHAPMPPKLDDELTELAIALSQYEIDEGPGGWLKMPWRNGWNAALFAASAAKEMERRSRAPAFVGDLRHQHLMGLLEPALRSRAYWDLQNLIESSRTIEEGPFARAAYRCAQVMLTESGSGDGSIFNAILERPLETLARSAESLTVALTSFMEQARCHDALGIPGPSLQNDRNDYLRRAFSIAWRRRLYAAAYSLPPGAISP